MRRLYAMGIVAAGVLSGCSIQNRTQYREEGLDVTGHNPIEIEKETETKTYEMKDFIRTLRGRGIILRGPDDSFYVGEESARLEA